MNEIDDNSMQNAPETAMPGTNTHPYRTYPNTVSVDGFTFKACEDTIHCNIKPTGLNMFCAQIEIYDGQGKLLNEIKTTSVMRLSGIMRKVVEELQQQYEHRLQQVVELLNTNQCEIINGHIYKHSVGTSDSITALTLTNPMTLVQVQDHGRLPLPKELRSLLPDTARFSMV